ncbi:f-box family protein [Corchorus olitorius]|uniref:F-box family protein n=1 Tax=Corchorus olitorius TaxID=93759 RepID=A0A1R3JEG0_9ROSI|nr:f-box family protein [Corchorus olitorius]
MTYLDSHNIQHLIFKSPSTKAYPTLFPPTQSSSLSSSLRILELDSCHVDLSNPTPCMPKLTTLYLNGCDFAPNSKTLDQLEFDPFASCVNLKQLYLHKCQFSEGITLKITAPRLVSLDITELTIPHKRDAAFDHIIKLEIWTPKLLSLRLNLYMPLDFSCLHLPVLENLDVQICSATTNNRTTVSFLLNMFRGFHNAQRIKICSKIILILSLLHQLAALHTQPPLFTRLKTLTVQRLKGSSLNKIPDNVLSYFLKGTSLASVEYE